MFEQIYNSKKIYFSFIVQLEPPRPHLLRHVTIRVKSV